MMKRLVKRIGRSVGRRLVRFAFKFTLKRAGLTAWWIWPAIWLARKIGLKRWDDLLHKLHLVPGGYAVPTSWLCWWRQMTDEHTHEKSNA